LKTKRRYDTLPGIGSRHLTRLGLVFLARIAALPTVSATPSSFLGDATGKEVQPFSYAAKDEWAMSEFL
jgi:hypothetical protein